MKSIRKSLLPLFIAVIVSTQMMFVDAKTPILEVSASNIYLQAGQENHIQIRFKNTGDSSIYNIEALLVSETPGLSVITDTQKVFNEISREKTKTYEPTLYVDQNLDLGAYTLTLTVIYRRFGTELDTVITVPVSVVVNKAYVPKVKYRGTQNEGVSTGSEQTVEYMFESNFDGTLHDLEFTLSSQVSSIFLLEGLNYYFTELQANDKIILKPTVSILEGTPLLPYTLTATLSYTDAEENRYHQTFAIPLNVDSSKGSEVTILTVKEMTILDNHVQPGDIFDVEFEFSCSGADAYELMATLGFDPLSPVSSVSPTSIYVGDISKEQTKTVRYSLLLDGATSAGQYPVYISVSYTDSRGLPGAVTETLTLLAEGLIDYELLDISTGDIYPGGEFEMEADLLLVGTESVEFVSIELVEDTIFKRTQGSEEYIGAVDPDSPIPFDLDFKVDELTELGTYSMELKVHYRDHLNREHEVELDLPITVAEIVAENGNKKKGGFFDWLYSLLGWN